MRIVAIMLPLMVWLGIMWCRVGGPCAAGEAVSPQAEAVAVPMTMATPEVPVQPDAAGGETLRTAYRVVIDGERATLAGVAELRGRFKARRVAREAYPGMIRCVLVDAGGTVLAEELLVQPDRLCGVLAGEGAADFRRGPVMCQARLPKAVGAVALEVRRITGSGEILLGCFPVAK